MDKRALLVIGLVVIVGAGILVIQNSVRGDELSQEISRIQSSSRVSEATASVTISSYAFKEQVIKVKKGTKVTWTNKDNAPHTVTSDEGTVLDSKVLAQGQSYEKTFDQTGIFRYHCTPHPQMIAAVIVVE